MPPTKESLPPRVPSTTDAAPVENFTLQRLDAICTRLEVEQVSERTDITHELPFHIQEEVMKRLPVKSLIQFRRVSKSWKSLIDSSRFIAAHSFFCHNQPQHLLIWYTNRHGVKCVSFVDDDSFPHQRFVPTLPCSLGSPRVVGSSYGLLCLEGVDATHQAGKNYEERIVVIWNPSLRKSIAIDVPKRLDDNYGEMKVSRIIGFGVCPVTIDPKIVHITQPCSWSGGRKQQFGNFWKVSVYKLSSGNFRNLSSSSNNLPSVSIQVEQVEVEDSSVQVVIDRFIYWCVVVVDGKGYQTPGNLIMSFDITDEIFKVVDLPDNLARHTRPGKLSISKLRESLVMLEYNKEHVSCGVWKMTDQRLFTKLFTIKAPCGSPMIYALGFRKRGEPIMEVFEFDRTFNCRCPCALVLYEPITKHFNDLMIWGDADATSFVDSYMETLLLIDRSDDCTIY